MKVEKSEMHRGQPQQSNCQNTEALSLTHPVTLC